MKENLYSDIIENDKIVSKYKNELPKNLQNLKYTTISNNNNLRKPFNNEIKTDGDETNKTTKSFNEKKFIIHIDSVNKVIETSMLKSSYIVYRVRFTRLSDLESRACWKRYRDIHTWYQEVINNLSYYIYIIINTLLYLFIIQYIYNYLIYSYK